MKLHSIKFLEPSKYIIVFLLLFLSCKPEKIVREVDAFVNLSNRIEYQDGQYIINFKLAAFEYKKVTVRLSNSLNSFNRITQNGQIYTAVLDQNYGCKVFLNPLSAKQKYYYQITVEDMVNRIVVSDVYNFTTQ
ncbi:hypothetical protein [Sphingobacterium composti Ten et al. 2007 non Yoo et al. 2007]|uniref:hypothetical protein n=1 Tax=Sphingobacterium composti TaxID=363260 RepID=UPI001358C473|nr:hypothetical protein [Sphingobacterium composti Ten et al. 2007 non Yoo et al. 2007]